MKKRRYWVSEKGGCPICKSEIKISCIGPYCSNNQCKGRWVDGTALLTVKQAKKLRKKGFKVRLFRICWAGSRCGPIVQ